jgi:hypothetical protein
MPIAKARYSISIRNKVISTLPIENGPWHKLENTEPIVTTQRNNFNGPRQVHFIFDVGKYAKTKHVKDMPICITIGMPPHSVINNKSVPLDLGGDPSKP